MDDKEKLSVSIYHLFVGFKDTFTLPTDATLEKTMKFAALMFLCSALSSLLGLYTFVSWQGCLVCLIVLIALLWVERRENDALLRMYRNARVSAQKVAQRAKDASAGHSGGRRTTGNGSAQQKTGGRAGHGATGEAKGHNGSNSRGKQRTGNTRPNGHNEAGARKRSNRSS